MLKDLVTKFGKMADMEVDDTVTNSSEEECHKLLMDLKCTVERLLAVHASNVWSTYGGFKRVSSHIEAILCHRIITKQMSTPSDGVFWPFVRGLKWLQPGMTTAIERVSKSSASSNVGSKGQIWLQESLRDHSLSSQLKILVSDPEHLHYHYTDAAFLQNAEYVSAMMICLHAIENNKVAGLADINPRLLRPQLTVPPSNEVTIPGAGGSNSVVSVSERVVSSPSAVSWSEPSLASSPLGSDHRPSVDSSDCSEKGGRRLSSDDAVTAPNAGCSPHLWSSSVPPVPLDSCHHGHSAPLISQHDSASLGSRNSQVLPSSTDAQGPAQSRVLRKCMSEGGSSTGKDEVDSGSMYSDLKAEVISPQKKIHIPDKDSKRYSRGSWQRMSSSEAPKSDGGVSKGHKRSFSDIAVGGRRVSGGTKKPDVLSRSQEVGSLSFKPQDNKVQQDYFTQKNQTVTLHRGDSLFQPPAKGQSLMSYLSEQDFNCCALLERENAHFGISDVLISVFEQMKWEMLLRRQSLTDETFEEEESDDEINELKQRIRIRRRERLVEKAKRFPANSDGMNDASTSSSVFTASSPLSSHGFSSLSESSDQSDDAEEQIELTFSGTETSNLAKLTNSGLSLSMASLYSDAELKKSNLSVENRGVEKQSSEKSSFSAEAIALSLLSQFSEKRLPKASELDWLVSEKDAPQALLPLPNSYPVSPDDGENTDFVHTTNQTKLRGNLEWAPPRPQIIFTIHPQEKRSIVLGRQNMRCAGCGTKIEAAFVKRLRYCEYMGKYFCQCCHSNETEVIPGRVIQRWDFGRYPVSTFAQDVLSKVRSQPLFHVDALNPALYSRVRSLHTTRTLRRQLAHLYTLLNICKRNARWLEDADKLPKHWSDDDNLYSMEDFTAVRSGDMPAVLKSVVTEAISHVQSCPLCQGLGFICEICQGTDIIFPFQLNVIICCPVCQACYHKSCYIPDKCPKCSRMEIRRKRQAQTSQTEDQKIGSEGLGS